MVYKAEKNYGVCRHMLIPSPSDALVFQVLTDELYEALMKAQPSKGAFYSRDRHFLGLPHQQEEAASYPWFVLWPIFQRKVWSFSKSCTFVVTTDLANYFDNIGLKELRHVVSSLASTKEVFLDLLFSLIEDLSWHPDYLPSSNKGLPTINIEAPRLLAHALLFEVDHVLKERTGDNFVRWMDDINFGVDTSIEANRILGEINDVLKSRGLALNLAKTSILTPESARNDFLFEENKHLDRIQKKAKALKTAKAKHKLAVTTKKELKKHLRKCAARNKDKITKRYLTTLGMLEDPVAVPIAKDLFIDSPGMRTGALKYISRTKFSKPSARFLLNILDEVAYLDHVTYFQIVEMLVRWAIPRDYRGKWVVDEVLQRLGNHNDSFSWLCLVHFLVKYGEPNDALTVARNLKSYGAREPFFARQSMAVMARGIGINHKTVLTSWTKEITTGTSDSASVASNFLTIWEHGFPAKSHRLYKYLFPENKQVIYPSSKFLLLCVLAKRDLEKQFKKPREIVTQYVKDDWHVHWLKGINPYWF